MISPEIEKLLIKFFNQSTTNEDLDLLNHWIKNPKNQSIFKDYVKTHYVITLGMNNPSLDKTKECLLKEIKKEKNLFHRSQFRVFYKYAAIAILCLGIGYLLQKNSLDTKEEALTPEERTITLKLENGDTQIISEDGDTNIVDVSGTIIMQQQGTQLVYNKNISTEKLKYNTLTIPYGKRFDIILSDGTHVFLNSGSSIKYPIKFIPGNPRKVFLEGEAFFDVTKDEKHPFLIEAQSLDVKVLGTKFNVTTYPGDSETEVVLVEGSVSLSSSENKSDGEQDVILKPGFKGTFDNVEQTISTQNVNTSIYTSWVEGIIVFRNVPFEDIIKKLERQYNVTIINNNRDLAKEAFNASFEIDRETIDEVLHYFNKVHQIKYKIINNKVIIE
ncbi:FecR family protein [Aquimarina sp. AU58]|uniref:FecR family protein n=1 Tax=Aquimarina sp. AU58 TaxID=1874112 RepID=UPI000D648F7F|nr:FecR domain-containing protein [Aquimarina sp. AU58]